MKGEPGHGPWRLFASERARLIVSGVGKLRAALATQAPKLRGSTGGLSIRAVAPNPPVDRLDIKIVHQRVDLADRSVGQFRFVASLLPPICCTITTTILA